MLEGRNESSRLQISRRLHVVLRHEVHHPGLVHLRAHAAQFLRRYHLAGHLLDHRGPGDEDQPVARLDDEIGQRRAVRRAARAGSADQRNLRHHAGEHHVLVKDARIPRQAGDAFLHARAARIVDEDERRAGLHRRLHGVGDFVGVDLARRAAGHGEILAGHMDRPPGDPPAPGDHSIGRQILIAHAEEFAVVLGEQPRFLEGIAIQQQGHAFPRGEFSALVLLGGALRPAPQFQPVPGLPRDPQILSVVIWCVPQRVLYLNILILLQNLTAR